MRGIIEDFIFYDILSIAMVILFGLPVLVLLLIGYKKLFKKCNEKEWQVFIPIYNTYILGEIAGVNWIYSFLANIFFIIETLSIYKYELVFFLISLIGKYAIHIKICEMFNKDKYYAILMTIFPLPMYCMLGLSKDMPIKASNKRNITIEYNDKTEIIPLTHIKNNKNEIIIDNEDDINDLDKTDVFEIPIINVKFKEPKTEMIKSTEKTDIIDSIVKEKSAKKNVKKSVKKKTNTKTKSKIKPKTKEVKERKPRPKKLPKNRKKNKNKKRK